MTTVLMGCSNAQGTYESNNDFIFGSRGYGDLAATMLDEQWKVLSFPGDGLKMYAQALCHLGNHKIDTLIIQGTYEPRVSYYNNLQSYMDALDDYMSADDRPLPFRYIYKDMVFTGSPRSLYELHESKFKRGKTCWLDTVEEITQPFNFYNSPTTPANALESQVYIDYIKATCDQRGIRLYTFEWFPTSVGDLVTYPNRLMKRTMVDEVIHRKGDAFYKKHRSEPGWHPTSLLVEMAAEILVDALEVSGYK